MPRVFIIILNWNSWAHTLECLESVFRINYPNYTVVVCDNDSQDGSLNFIKEWAEGQAPGVTAATSSLRRYSYPPVVKPIPYVVLHGENVDARTGAIEISNADLILIQIGANRGFAGGNNVGLRLALARDDCEYIWLLNNDTVVDPDSLKYMVHQMQVDIHAGFCGSTLLDYYEPDKIQAMGGARYNKWLAGSTFIGKGKPRAHRVDISMVISQLDFILGASMLVRKAILRRIGLMDERYFLYFEEIDWALRLHGHYGLTYAPDSVVYHKEGGSIGSSGDPRHKERSVTADYYGIRNRLLFTRTHFPEAMLTVYLGVLAAIPLRILRRQWVRVLMILRIIANSTSDVNVHAESPKDSQKA